MRFERKFQPIKEKEGREKEAELNARIDALEKKNDDSPKKSKKEVVFNLTGEQKVLALHYLGFCDDVDTGTQKGKIYEYFLDGFKYKSILKIFSGLSDYETEKNLNTLIDFFRHIEQRPIARKLEDKLANLNKNRLKK
jgi:hypothetical protein